MDTWFWGLERSLYAVNGGKNFVFNLDRQRSCVGLVFTQRSYGRNWVTYKTYLVDGQCVLVP